MNLDPFENSKDFDSPELEWFCTFTPEEVIQALGLLLMIDQIDSSLDMLQ
jgi:hypothetical protein